MGIIGFWSQKKVDFVDFQRGIGNLSFGNGFDDLEKLIRDVSRHLVQRFWECTMFSLTWHENVEFWGKWA